MTPDLPGWLDADAAQTETAAPFPERQSWKVVRQSRRAMAPIIVAYDGNHARQHTLPPRARRVSGDVGLPEVDMRAMIAERESGVLSVDIAGSNET